MSFYHAFKIGFNWWYVVAPLMVVFGILFSTAANCQIRTARDRETGLPFLRMRRVRHSDAYAGTLAGIALAIVALATVVFGVMLCVESSSGILQLLDNNTAADTSPAWNLPAAAVVMAFVMGIYAYIMFLAVTAGHYLVGGLMFIYNVIMALVQITIVGCRKLFRCSSEDSADHYHIGS